MAAGARRVLGDRIVSALIVSPEPVDAAPPFAMMVGGHPLPTPGASGPGAARWRSPNRCSPASASCACSREAPPR